MATIILGSYMVRYPLGGNLSWALQYLIGLKNLGHEVYFVEKYAYPNSCYNPVEKSQSDNCTYGVRVVSDLLKRYGLENKWCFVENGDIYHGLSKKEIEKVFRRADLYIDSGAHCAWQEEASFAKKTVFIDGDPGYKQFQFYNDRQNGKSLPLYDYYYTNGKNVGEAGNSIPTVGIKWGHIYSPVNIEIFPFTKPPKNSLFSTIMNWKSYSNVEFNGIMYGQKDIEFEKFESLPELAKHPIEIAVSGIEEAKAKNLEQKGWVIGSAQEVTLSFDSFRKYLFSCKGEFSVCKNVYIATSSGWFSDKSAAYLASGRPVILQDSGFSKHLPIGNGLFAVNNVEDAANAIDKVMSKYEWHCQMAREIAAEYLEGEKIFKTFLQEIGL